MASYKTKHTLNIQSNDYVSWYFPKGVGNLCQNKSLHKMFAEALFKISKPWKKPRCLLVGESVVVVQLFSHVWLFATPLAAVCQVSCTLPSSKACSNSCPLSRWCHPTISSSVIPFSCLQSFPVIRVFTMSQLFTSGGQSIGASASASVLSMNTWGWFPLGLTGLISLSPRDSQKSSPTPQFENISPSVHSLLYSPTLLSIHDYWKNHSFDYTGLCQQSDVSAFYYTVCRCPGFSQGHWESKSNFGIKKIWVEILVLSLTSVCPIKAAFSHL